MTIKKTMPYLFDDSKDDLKSFEKHLSDIFLKEHLELVEKIHDIFTKNYWLSENSTKQYYISLSKYLELSHQFYKLQLYTEKNLKIIKEHFEYPENLFQDVEENLIRLTETLKNYRF